MGQNYDTGGALRRPFEAPAGTGTLFGQTMGLVVVTPALFTLGAYLARNLSGWWSLVFWIASLACLLAMNVTVRRSEQLTLGLLFGFGLLVGLAAAPTISYHANVDPEAVWEAGGATTVFVAGSCAAGYATRRDLSALARVLWWALIPAAARHQRDRQRAAAGGLGLPRHPQRLPVLPQSSHGVAIDGSDRPTDDAPNLTTGRRTHDDERE